MRYTRAKASRPARIVLVAPDPHLLALFNWAHPDLDVATVSGPAELQAALDEGAELAVIDVEDPLLAHVLAHDACPRIVVTAHHTPRTGDEFDGVLHRPYAPRDVSRIVLEVLGGDAEPRLDPPPAGRPIDLTTALRNHCRELAALRRPVIHVDAQPVPRLAPDRERALLDVVRDLIDLAQRSPGTERTYVVLSASVDTVLILVDNQGGDTSRMNHPAGGLGLRNLRVQAAAFGGIIDLLAGRDRGYRVAVACPVEVEVGA